MGVLVYTNEITQFNIWAQDASGQPGARLPERDLGQSETPG